jgi:proton glutamate symport protein
MQAMERIGVPRQIVAFVMPTGYTFNLDGSTLYLSLTSIFVAQAAGIHLTIGQQFVMLLTLMLSSKGVAGVPRGAVVVLLGTISTFRAAGRTCARDPGDRRGSRYAADVRSTSSATASLPW